jgi:hypothetical protein
VTTGTGVTGEIVMRSHVHDDPYHHLYLKGTISGNDLRLGLDKDRIPYPFDFTLLGIIKPNPGLSGTISFPLLGLTADIECSTLDVGDLMVAGSFNLDTTALGLAFDGDRLWVSTATDDYMRMNLSGSVLDTVVVLYLNQYHWTSDALTSDGEHLWGHLPVTVQDQGGRRNESDIHRFTKDGVITRTFRLGHRTSGLASDGAYLWSVPLASDAFYRFDSTGTIVDTVDVQLPDLVDLDYDGTHFWAIGWFTQQLYQINRTGQTVRVYDLPDKDNLNFPLGIVFDGTHFWYSFSTSDRESRIYKLSIEP